MNPANPVYEIENKDGNLEQHLRPSSTHEADGGNYGPKADEIRTSRGFTWIQRIEILSEQLLAFPIAEGYGKYGLQEQRCLQLGVDFRRITVPAVARKFLSTRINTIMSPIDLTRPCESSDLGFEMEPAKQLDVDG